MLLRAAWGKTRIKNMPELLAGVRTGIALSSGFSVPDLFQTWRRSVLAAVTGMKRGLESLHKAVDSVFEEVIEERMCARAENVKTGAENVDENLVDVLIGMQEKGDSVFPIDKPRIKAFLLDTLAAGTGTSGSAMEWTMSELIRNPKVMAKLQEQIREAFRGKAVVTEGDMQAADIRYLKLVMKEALRLHPPAPLLVGRESIDVCEVDGYTITAKSRVLVNVWAISQDPKYWDAPEEFKPERFEKGDIDFMGSHYEFTPFGAGRRMCPGISYGLASMELALVSLLYHFDWSLPEGVSELDMGEAPGLGVRRRSPLLLRATPVLPADCAE
ncbi:hypothetical protein CFC21_030005 [Triticum aestivum]|nr:hypothetical protein CFC21_030003 [Triticum aestivum]KAF7016381.1 hypothetical protein CFC21_030005 [Triticum aestivum]